MSTTCIFETLPTELLYQIVEPLYRGSLRNFRAVNHFTYKLATPLLFKKLVLNFEPEYIYSQDRADIFIRKIEQIHTYSDLYFLFENVQDLAIVRYDLRHLARLYDTYPQKLPFISGLEAHQPDDTKNALILKVLEKFVLSFKNLKRFKWNLNDLKVPPSIDISSISAAITHLELSAKGASLLLPSFAASQNITDLSISLRKAEPAAVVMSLSHLENLDIICDRAISTFDFLAANATPHLTTLNLSGGFITNPFPASLAPTCFSMLHTLSLTGYIIEGDGKYSIWDGLREHNIHLVQLTVENYNEDESLISYLKSYSNTLKKLDGFVSPLFYEKYEPECQGISKCDNIFTFMDIFWRDVISAHSSTLESLKIRPTGMYTLDDVMRSKEAWVVSDYMPAAAEALLKCEKLEHLDLLSLAENGLFEIVDVAIRMPKLRRITYGIKGHTKKPRSRCGGQLHKNMEMMKGMESRISSMRWNWEGGDDEKWRELTVVVMPMEGNEYTLSNKDSEDELRLTSEWSFYC
ncbi:hypothetical protein ABW20_dc0105604 [Dactylellina cionopaga]|nr:hypothetical protein ABW20_dc0105604 [Dactylellina cionopaga]